MLRSTHTFARRSRLVAKLLGVALILAAAAPLNAQTPVQFGDTISDPGVYFLAGNQSGSGLGISIESDDVVLLLTRFTLRGDGSNTGIAAGGRENVQIYGGRVTRFEVGIDLFGCSECTVKDVRVDHCGRTGVLLRNTDESWFLRLRCDYNGEHGIQAQGCDDNRFISILSHDNDRDGILFDPFIQTASSLLPIDTSDGNKVKLCWTSYNGHDGIHAVDSNDNEIERNQCVQNRGVGIHLGTRITPPCLGDCSLAVDGSHLNEIRSNWCVFNGDGIVLEPSATDNTLTNNTALVNSHHDMVDDNSAPPCANTWFLNFFLFRSGAGAACIL